MSPETQTLGELLGRYPRRTISQCLQTVSDLDELLSTLRNIPEKKERRVWAGKHVDALSQHTQMGELVGFFDPKFPALLREIPDPPLILHILGDPDCLNRPSIAIVGARRCTIQGRILAERFAHSLGGDGFTVVSGLALGIDAQAHKGALSAQARTLACLGSGLDQIYPRSHAKLSQQIASAGGLLLSEYHAGVKAKPYHFPERNRIISGLCVGVLVVEAGEKSGSLITARMALEQGRDVFALPGPVDNFVSRGCHRLIREGAELVVAPEQIVESLNVAIPREGKDADTPMEFPELSPEQSYFVELTSGYARNLDELMAISGWDTGPIMRLLGELELLGIVRPTPDGYIASIPTR